MCFKTTLVATLSVILKLIMVIKLLDFLYSNYNKLNKLSAPSTLSPRFKEEARSSNRKP